MALYIWKSISVPHIIHTCESILDTVIITHRPRLNFANWSWTAQTVVPCSALSCPSSTRHLCRSRARYLVINVRSAVVEEGGLKAVYRVTELSQVLAFVPCL